MTDITGFLASRSFLFFCPRFLEWVATALLSGSEGADRGGIYIATTWDRFDEHIVRQIITFLCLAKDKASLDAMMQTSRSFRALAASCIPSAALIGGYFNCLDRFPMHATARAMRICMTPSKTICFLNASLIHTKGEHGRLSKVKKVAVSFASRTLPSDGHEDRNDRRFLSSLCEDSWVASSNGITEVLTSIGQTFPDIEELEVCGFYVADAGTLFSSIMKHLPGITSLYIADGNCLPSLTWCMDSLPRGLRSFRAPSCQAVQFLPVCS